MKTILFAAMALIASAGAFASDFPAGTYHCSSVDKKLQSTWKISALSDSAIGLPLVEVSLDDGVGPATIRQIATLEVNAKGTILGVSSPVTHNNVGLAFSKDGVTISQGTMSCKAE